MLPEEVAQRYGYSPDQRVVNIILKRNFSSREVEAEYGQPWDGGYSTKQVEATYLQIAGESRLNFNLGWDDTSLLTEAERGIIQSNRADLSRPIPIRPTYRSLVERYRRDRGERPTSPPGSATAAPRSASTPLSSATTRLRFQGLDSVRADRARRRDARCARSTRTTR